MEQDERLTGLAYESTVHPSRYDDLIADWDSHIRRLLLLNGAESPSFELDEDLARHFNRALQVFERMGRQQLAPASNVTVQHLVDTQPNCALAFNSRGDLAAVNEAARQMLGLPAQPTIEQLPIDGLSRASIRDALSQVRASGEPQPLVVRDTMDRPLVLLTTPATNDGVIVANAVSGRWTDVTERLLCEGFGITTTELALLKGVYDGQSLRNIAEQRSRSLGTVRTQLKAVQQKTGAHSQPALIRLVTGLIFACNSADAPELDSHATPRSHPKAPHTGAPKLLELPYGRQIVYNDYGNTDSTNVVIFLHGMLDSPSLPIAFEKQFITNNTRCISIQRPGYGESSPYAKDGHLGERFASDLEEILDVLNLETVSLIGHLSGGVFACIAAAQLGDRIRAVVNINGGVPIVSRQQFEIMTPRQRVIALTARYAPKALPLMVRAGIALLDNGGERKFMRGLHRHSPRDHRLTQRPDVFAQLVEGYHFAIAQGHDAFQRESVLVTSNWDSYVAKIDCPVTYLHGAHDGVVSIESVREFANRHARIKLVECPEYGQLMLHGHPDDIGNATVTALQEQALNRQRSAN